MNFSFKVRSAGVEELGDVLDFLTGYPPERGFVKEVGREVGEGRIELFVVESGGGLVGAAVLAYRPSVSLQGWFASVEKLYVSHRWRGKGVGRALLDGIGARCSERGISYVEVQTDEEAAGFYEAAGYEYEDKVKVYSISLLRGDQNSRTS